LGLHQSSGPSLSINNTDAAGAPHLADLQKPRIPLSVKRSPAYGVPLAKVSNTHEHFHFILLIQQRGKTDALAGAPRHTTVFLISP
jgi:hypothetical protein